MTTTNELALQYPALVHTGMTKMDFDTLLRGAEILTALYGAKAKVLNHVWGYDPDVTNKEHHSGRALDFMVHGDKPAGDWIADYIIEHAERLGLIHVIWYQRIWRGPYSTSTNPKGVWQDMADRGSPTKNHLDHPHAWFADTTYVPKEDDIMSEEAVTILKQIAADSKATRAMVEALAGFPPAEPDPPAPSTPPKDNQGDTLRLGDHGKAVLLAKERLAYHGRKVNMHDQFLDPMLASVKRFQTDSGLPVDGVVGPKTWEALMAGKSKPPPVEPAPTPKIDVPAILRRMGWRTGNARDVQAFQHMYNLGPALVADGKIGPKTEAAIQVCIDNGDRISDHFKPIEFSCKCGGKYSGCRRILAHRELVIDAEVYRTLAGPFRPNTVSAYRCAEHNASDAVKGYKYSAHVAGLAFDVPAIYSLTRVMGLKRFAAIGYNSDRLKTVRHLDRRNLGAIMGMPEVNNPKISGAPNGYTFDY